MNMRYVVLNGDAITSKDRLYDALEEHFDLPAYFSRNLDSLNDSLTGQKLTVEIRNSAGLIENLGGYGEKFLRMMKDLDKRNSGITVIEK